MRLDGVGSEHKCRRGQVKGVDHLFMLFSTWARTGNLGGSGGVDLRGRDREPKFEACGK